jgi:DNA-binding response OmpR family regulator
MIDGLYAGCFEDYVLKPFNIEELYKLLGHRLFKE